MGALKTTRRSSRRQENPLSSHEELTRLLREKWEGKEDGVGGQRVGGLDAAARKPHTTLVPVESAHQAVTEVLVEAQRAAEQQADQSRREQAESVAAASEREVVELQRAANEEHEALLEKLKKMGKKGLDAALKKRALSTEGSAKEVKQRLLAVTQGSSTSTNPVLRTLWSGISSTEPAQLLQAVEAEKVEADLARHK
jgi:hypothetical protein